MSADEYDYMDIELAAAMMEVIDYDAEKIEGTVKLLNSALEKGDYESMSTILGMIGSIFLTHKNILQ